LGLLVLPPAGRKIKIYIIEELRSVTIFNNVDRKSRTENIFVRSAWFIINRKKAYIKLDDN
jgi:hypothetical protein